MNIRKHWLAWLIGVVVAAVVLVVGVPFAYVNFVEGNQPAALTLESTPSSTGAATSVDGAWKVASGSQAGYRVHETLAGQSVTAVGRGTGVTGNLVIAGTNVSSATFTVDMTKIRSDQDQRDQRFLGIVDTAQFPTATFTITKPIALGSIPAAGQTVSTTATGNLTVHGVTKRVSVPIKANVSGNTIQVQGNITVTFADYGVQAPNIANFVKVDPSGQIEFLLKLTK
ncbi:YceI family protein [Fodinicola acaciae]|uniref:YceI family protein n=1 Tax=Fodinicola acaciae TaxID=2681555 RepID=UPI0013D6BED7|nr:YceI family protein [Fodinicola acaciae]